MNNGAAAGYIAEHVTEFHQRMLSKAGIAASLPENPVFDTVSNAIYSAWYKLNKYINISFNSSRLNRLDILVE